MSATDHELSEAMRAPHSPSVSAPSPEEAGVLPADVVREVEVRANVEPLGDLHAQRRQLLITFAPLKALHGHNGLYDDKRKSMLEAMKIKARAKCAEDGVKATEGLVDAMAYADPQYERFLDNGYQDRIEYIVQANTMSELDERIRSREVELLVYNSEARLAR